MYINQNAALLAGLFTWILCILCIHQLKLSLENNSAEKIHYTILIFFILNTVFSFSNYFLIVLDSGSLNPFLYQGQHQKYFIGTGDNIRGVTFDSSITNALLNAMGVVYFLHRKQLIMTFVCMAVLLLTASNLTNFLVAGVLIYMFIFQSQRWQKSAIIVCLMFLLIFIAKISPQNNQYTLEVFRKIFNIEKATQPQAANISLTERADSTLTPEERKQKIALLYLDSIHQILLERTKLRGNSNPYSISGIKSFEPNIHTLPFQRKRDTSHLQEKLMTVANQISADSLVDRVKGAHDNLPGKAIAFKQTLEFFKSRPQRIFLGTGMGNFSSKLAFRISGLNISGGYPPQLAYVNQEFRNNHLAEYVYFFGRDAQFHSIVNSPNSVYNQLAGEYGLAGILAFIFFYIGFFVKRMRKNSLLIPLLLLLTGAFFFDYWFEQLSAVVLFELLILLSIKENELNKEIRNSN
jgi:hypothetical protein